MKGLLLVGATGSIGCSTLDVVAALPDDLRLAGVFAGSNGPALAEIARRFDVSFAGLSGDAAPDGCGRARTGCGDDFLREAVESPEVDVVLNAATGAAGLPASIHAARAGKTLALANKESLVMAGPLLAGARVVPVDSEHGAIHQCLRAGRSEEVARVILTASGGPFRTWSAAKIARATPEDALDHPTWSMGPKITVDSASLVNKALELIEAHWIFGLAPEQLDAVVHPQSIVHSFVEFRDGSVLAQLGAPDMRVAIQYALCWPERKAPAFTRFDVKDYRELTFEEPDRARFPALDLAYDVMRRGGTAGAVFNAANEVAVERFLAGDIPFPAITETVASVLASVETAPATDLETILAADKAAREEAISCCT